MRPDLAKNSLRLVMTSAKIQSLLTRAVVSLTEVSEHARIGRRHDDSET